MATHKRQVLIDDNSIPFYTVDIKSFSTHRQTIAIMQFYTFLQ